MPKFNIAVDHGIDRDDAVSRLKGFSEKILQDTPVDVTDVVEQWDADGNLEFAFRAMGLKIAGTVVTCESQVTVAGQLPFAAIAFRGQIEKQIEAKLREALADAS